MNFFFRLIKHYARAAKLSAPSAPFDKASYVESRLLHLEECYGLQRPIPRADRREGAVIIGRYVPLTEEERERLTFAIVTEIW